MSADSSRPFGRLLASLGLRPAFGSHNIRSLAHALAAAQLMGVPLGTVKGRMRIGLQKLKAMLERPELGVSGA